MSTDENKSEYAFQWDIEKLILDIAWPSITKDQCDELALKVKHFIDREIVMVAKRKS